jgi:hypothetical protein
MNDWFVTLIVIIVIVSLLTGHLLNQMLKELVRIRFTLERLERLPK